MLQENTRKNPTVNGKIIKSISGFYEVHTRQGVYRCRARGLFRALGQKPLVGDDVEIEITDTVSVPPEGNVVRLLPRRNSLIRPNVCNVDQALLLFAVTHPVPSYNMLDRFLILMDRKELPAILCFNKTDLATPEEISALRSTYEDCGCQVLFMSNYAGEGIDRLREILRGKTTVFTGPSGAGKSTLINLLCPGARMETGELSRKIARGKNTTRHIELLSSEETGEDTYLVDTPGFTSLFLEEMEASQLRYSYPEFTPYEGKCRFNGCVHVHEPSCAVKAALSEGKIHPIRYRNYCELFEELKAAEGRYR